MGASLGFSNAVELAVPISQRTVDADAIGQYQRHRAHERRAEVHFASTGACVPYPVQDHLGSLDPALAELGRLGGIGLLVAVVACSALAQFVLYTSWVLYTTFKFGWGPLENGWSLFAVGVVAAVVQGGLLGRLLKVFSPQRLAVLGTQFSQNVLGDEEDWALPLSEAQMAGLPGSARDAAAAKARALKLDAPLTIEHNRRPQRYGLYLMLFLL